MTIVFAGIILGIILMFFVLAFATGAIIIVVPGIVLVVALIQLFLKIRDQVLDNRDRNR
jgi:hypothetical protein